MRKRNELTAKDLKDVCNPNLFKFETTKELIDTSDLIYGHAWVIDGYVQYESKGTLVPGGYLLHDVLFHCVWGWGGKSNGYFKV